MMGKIDILIPEHGGKIGTVVVESLRRHGLMVEQIDDRNVLNDGPGFLRLLRASLESYSPSMILPIFRSETVARHRSELPEGVILPVADADVMRLLDDKVSASELCRSLGIPQPHLYADNEFDAITDYPVVFKRNHGLSGSGVYFPKDRIALDNLVASTKGRPHLVMDFIEGDDVCVDAIRWDGYFHAECYKVLLPKGKGISLVRQTVCAPSLVSHVRTILDACDYKGVCGVDFRIDVKTGEAFFLECNPRFSGGINTQIAAGFDIPFILWQLANCQSPAPVTFIPNLIDSDQDRGV